MSYQVQDAEFLKLYSETNRLSSGTPHSFTELPNRNIAFLRSPGDSNKQSLWAIDLDSGQEVLLIDSDDLDGGAEGAAQKAARERTRNQSGGIYSYSYSKAKGCLVIAQGNDIYFYDLQTSEIEKFQVEFDEEVFDPQVSPDGTHLAFHDSGALKLASLADGPASTTLISPENSLVFFGKADFVSAEEIGRGRGFWWSPDSKKLVVTQVDETNTELLNLSNPAHPTQAPTLLKYPPAGGTNPVTRLLTVTTEGLVTELEWPKIHGTVAEYLVSVIWTGDVIRARFENREQTELIECSYTGPGSWTVTNTLSSDTWLEVGPQLYKATSDVVAEIVCSSSGRVLVVNGEIINTHGYLRAIVSVEPDKVWFSASPNPFDVHLYCLNLDTKSIEQITQGEGMHSATIGQDTIVIASKNMDSIRTSTRIYSKESGSQLQTVKSEIQDVGQEAPFRVHSNFHDLGDGNRIAVFTPENHNGQVLPVLMDPYGGPHAQRVIRSLRPHLVSQWFANLGFLVVVTDGIGTPGVNTDCDQGIYRNLAAPTVDSQLCALEFVKKQYPFADSSRVGIRGWSFGGYLAALCAIAEPESFHCAVSGAPVTEWELYDTHYTERYLGTPQANPDAYEASNLTHRASELARPLLLIHGLNDDNVVPANSFRLTNELSKNGIKHETLFIDGLTHSPKGETLVRVLSAEARFLSNHLL